ncbi:MAG TPA: PD-(D/E)XK nuclease family protein, partial [Clostridia bacterium]
SRGEDRAFADKASDLAFLMENYDARMRGLGLHDREDDLWRLADALMELHGAIAVQPPGDVPLPWPIGRAGFLASTSIWIAGFGQTRDFTPQEYAVLSGLEAVCAQVTVTVCADSAPGDDAAVEAGPDAFRIGRMVARRLSARFPGTVAREAASSLAPPFDRVGRTILHMPDPRPGQGQEPAAHAADPQPSESAVTTVLLRGQEDEIRWVAGEIRRLTLTCGYRYSDIAIGVNNPSGYLPSLRAVFREFGLSPFIDEPRPLVGTALYRFLRGLLDLQVQDWSLPAVTACLRSDFCRIRRDEADRLENFLMARGITGAGRIFDERRYRAGFESLTALPAGNGEEDGDGPEPDEIQADKKGKHATDATAALEARTLRDRVLVPLRDFLRGMAAEPSCAGKCRLLTEFLEAYGARRTVEDRSAGLHASGEDEAAITLVRAWNEIARVLEQMAAIAGDGRYSMEEFRDALAAGMEGAQSGTIPPVIDRITVSGYTRAGFRRARVLFLMGAQDDGFPGSAAPEGLLKDPDRERISLQLGIRLPSVLRDQVFADAALAYALLTAPTDRLYMTAPAGGKPVSGYFDLLRRAVPEGCHLIAGPPEADDVRAGALRPARRHLLAAFSDPSILADGGRLRVLRALADTLGLPEQEQKNGRWHGWLEEDRITARLSPALILLAAGTHLRMSVSQLECYAACPYAYLSHYLLKLQERDVWSPQATDTGSMLHGILELAVRDFGGELSAAASEEERQAILERWTACDFDAYAAFRMREIAERDGFGLFFDTGIRASSGRRVLRLGAASLRAVIAQIVLDGTRPACTEWRFGMSGMAGENALTLYQQGTQVSFRGVIDRVDWVDPGGPGDKVDKVDPSDPGDEGMVPTGGTDECGPEDFRIVDYKSGNVHFDPDKVFYGLSLQLPAYAAAYRSAHPGSRPAELAYFRFQAPVASYNAHEGMPAEDDARDRIARQFKLEVTGL